MCLKLNIKFYMKITYCVGLYQQKDLKNGGVEYVQYTQYSYTRRILFTALAANTSIISSLEIKMFHTSSNIQHIGVVHYILYISVFFHISYNVQCIRVMQMHYLTLASYYSNVELNIKQICDPYICTLLVEITKYLVNIINIHYIYR